MQIFVGVGVGENDYSRQRKQQCKGPEAGECKQASCIEWREREMGGG